MFEWLKNFIQGVFNADIIAKILDILLKVKDILEKVIAWVIQIKDWLFNAVKGFFIG